MNKESSFFNGHSYGGDCAVCRAQKNSICSFVDEEGLKRVRTIASFKFTPKNKYLCHQGEPLDKISIVISGMVKLFQVQTDGESPVTGFLGPGDVLGGLRRNHTAQCTAQAINDVITCSLGRAAFMDLVRDHPDLAVSLLIAATDEIEAQHDHAVLLACADSRKKLATLLLLLSQRWKSVGDPDDEVHLPMSRRDIANYIGLTAETVSRTFSALKDEEIIEVPSPDRVRLRNLPKLYYIAGVEEIPDRRIALGL